MTPVCPFRLFRFSPNAVEKRLGCRARARRQVAADGAMRLKAHCRVWRATLAMRSFPRACGELGRQAVLSCVPDAALLRARPEQVLSIKRASAIGGPACRATPEPFAAGPLRHGGGHPGELRAGSVFSGITAALTEGFLLRTHGVFRLQYDRIVFFTPIEFVKRAFRANQANCCCRVGTRERGCIP
jgi:hypothetical protein